MHGIKRNSDGAVGSWTVQTDRGSEDYKAVIIAAPIHSTGINLPSAISSQIPKQPYVHLHVTLLTTTSRQPNPEYFSLSSSSKVPSMVLTTYNGVRKGGKEPEFNSLSYHGYAAKSVDGVPDEWSVKIFSKERISDEWLDKIFMGNVGWVYRKEVSSCHNMFPCLIRSCRRHLPVGCISTTSANNHLSARQVGRRPILRQRIRAVSRSRLHPIFLLFNQQQIYLDNGNGDHCISQCC